MYQTNISLKTYNTFGIDAKCQNLLSITQLEHLAPTIIQLQNDHIPYYVIGGGSNILFTKDYLGTIVQIAWKGIEILKENDEHVWVKVAAGEVWHDFVLFCINNNLSGIENLSLIPGTVGAAPIQNIGAYGAEVKQTIETVTYWHTETHKIEQLNNQQCDFGYRDSIFKNQLKGKAIITHLTFRLNKKNTPNLSYGTIQETLNQKGITEPTLQQISEAICAIRQSKLPNPAEIGNAGSFFKNPEIDKDLLLHLQTEYPSIPHYFIKEQKVKIPAAWLIEQCGWKGKKVGQAGVHHQQALVIVNYGEATGEQIWNIAQQIQKDVKNKFNIDIQPEINIL